MDWYITVEHDYRRIRLKVERVSAGNDIEIFRISGSNRSITIQNNRALLRNRGLKNRRIGWKLVEGQLQNTKLFELICKKLELINN